MRMLLRFDVAAARLRTDCNIFDPVRDRRAEASRSGGPHLSSARPPQASTREIMRAWVRRAAAFGGKGPHVASLRKLCPERCDLARGRQPPLSERKSRFSAAARSRPRAEGSAEIARTCGGPQLRPCEGPQLAPGSLHALRQLRPSNHASSAAAAHPAIRPRGRSAALFLKIGPKHPVIRLKTGKTRAVRSKFRFSGLQVSDFLYIYSRVMQKVQP